ncbi:hypothetical protein C8R46DRAFT_982140 [Mycena filopes]|nr:hypothetical protein C8R46DRAFT_982140 [Mycena filopes]
MLLVGSVPDLTGAISYHFEKVGLEKVLFFPPKTWQTNCGLNYLHLAAISGDVPLAHEAMRLGTLLDSQDSNGDSPLYLGIQALFNRKRMLAILPLHRVESAMARIRDVCLLLIAHHSDPNECPKGRKTSVLGAACALRDWELIRALLLHGASPAGLTILFDNETDKDRFRSLISDLATVARPARICICASGRLLEDCHQRPQSYPAHHLCPCGSRKVNSACCTKKGNMSWSEVWNEKKGWLDFGPTIRRSAQNANADSDETDLKHAMLVSGMMDCTPGNWLDKPNEIVLKLLIDQRRIDPAYVAVCKTTQMAPSPSVIRPIPKARWVQSRKRWNDAVDEYIASGVDNRAPEVIEAAAKIGYAGGPLRRKCEGAGCKKLETETEKAFSYCSGCTTAVYCSRACQKGAWKAHKTACRAGGVEAQLLPSQEAYLGELARVTGFRFT